MPTAPRLESEPAEGLPSPDPPPARELGLHSTLDALMPRASAPSLDGITVDVAAARLRGALFGDPARIVVGGFELLEELGRGGMGVVYRARDAGLQREVAVKLLLRDDEPTDDAARARRSARLIREAQVMARLSHPNVVQVYEVGEHRGMTYVAMELIAGTTLARWQQEALDARGPERWRAPSSTSTSPPGAASRPPTRPASSTGTSSPPTSSSIARAAPASATSASRAPPPAPKTPTPPPP